MFSTNASCGPFITFSMLGLSTERCLKPFTSISKATFSVSTNKIQFPELMSEIITLNSFCIFILFCGTNLSYI